MIWHGSTTGLVTARLHLFDQPSLARNRIPESRGVKDTRDSLLDC